MAQLALLAPSHQRWWQVQLKQRQWGDVPVRVGTGGQGRPKIPALTGLVDCEILYVLGWLACTDGMAASQPEINELPFDVSALDSSWHFQLPSFSPQQTLGRHKNYAYIVISTLINLVSWVAYTRLYFLPLKRNPALNLCWYGLIVFCFVLFFFSPPQALITSCGASVSAEREMRLPNAAAYRMCLKYKYSNLMKDRPDTCESVPASL